MSNALIFTLILLLIPFLGILGFSLSRHFGNKKYQQSILPKLQSLVSLLSPSNIFIGALDPDQWKTDKKSLLLIIFGLPIGLFIVFGFLFLMVYILGL